MIALPPHISFLVRKSHVNVSKFRPAVIVPTVRNRVGREALLTFLNGKSLIHPVLAEIVRDVEHLQLGEAHAMEGLVSRLYSRAMGPRAAATIENDESPVGERFHALSQLLDYFFPGGRANVF